MSGLVVTAMSASGRPRIPVPGVAFVGTKIFVLSLNVGGMVGAWRWLNTQKRCEYPVVCLQEFSGTVEQFRAFVACARHLGYLGFHAPSVGPKGGVVMLVATWLRSRPFEVISTPGGQAVFASVNGTLLGSVYMAHHEDCDEFLRSVLDTTMAGGSAWCLLGDWNLVPADNWFNDVVLRRCFGCCSGRGDGYTLGRQQDH